MSAALPVLVAGAGAWGTALALLLARRGVPTLLWTRSAERCAQLSAAGCNDCLPESAFPAALRPIHRLQDAHAVETVILAVPFQQLRHTATLLRAALPRCTHACIACKGIELDTLQLGHEVLAETLQPGVCSALSGPSFAAEAACGLPTAVSLGCVDAAEAARLAGMLHSECFRVYTTRDITGVELGGALKNVIAIAAGASDGLQLGANARAGLITRGLAELMRLGEALGAERKTFMGLSGVGDLMLSCADDRSRNRRYGKALATGVADPGAGDTVEGPPTALAVRRLARAHGTEMPIVEQVAAVVAGERSVDEALAQLLARARGAEHT